MEVVDPYRNLTRAQDLQTQYKFGANENIVILDYEGRNKFVNAADMAEFEMPDQMSMMMGQSQPKLKAFKGEQAMTSALLELKDGKPNKVYLLAGHGELDLKSPDLKLFVESLKRQNIEADSLNLLNVSSIPEGARTVIINGPKYDLSELEIKLLTDFWQKNGRLLVLLNPYGRTPRLAAWLAERGIAPQDDRVLRTGTFLAMGGGGSPELKSGVISNAGFEVMESGTKITKDLAGLSKQLLGATQSLMLDQVKEKTDRIRLIPLLQSSEGYWGETDYATSEDRTPFFDPKKDRMGPLTIAAAAERGGVEDPRVKVETSRLVVAGNAEMLGVNGYRQSEGVTVDFAINALNWLLDREELIGIPPKEKKNVTLVLTEKQIGNIALTVMGLVPGIAGMFGLLNWWSRRS
ncbi:MAG TPA: Gldg family protein, partial [Chthoniobacteraceae bacterium]